MFFYNKINMEDKKVVILSSGGIDSTACIHYYLNLKYNVNCNFIDYGQISATREEQALKRITDNFNIDFSVIKIEGYQKFGNGIIQGRNAVFIFIALMYMNFDIGLISLGIHKGTSYIDCSKDFITKANNLLELYTKGRIVLDTPFIDFTKKEIIEYCKLNDVPISHTYSCELGLDQPCGKCDTCNELGKLYAN